MRHARVIGGLMMRVAGALRPTAVRLEEAPTPHCWRCGDQLGLDDAHLAIGDAAFPWTWVCGGCVTDDDRRALGAQPDQRTDKTADLS